MASRRGPPPRPVVPFDDAMAAFNKMPLKTWSPKKLVAYSGKNFKHAPKWSEVIALSWKISVGHQLDVIVLNRLSVWETCFG